ncbi:MAG TPA: YhjD/YihY/BrkB family envelope integrity protein [Acidimicrobiia bacterium]|jgi:membrane protein
MEQRAPAVHAREAVASPEHHGVTRARARGAVAWSKRSYPGRVFRRMSHVDGWNQAMLLGANIVLTLLPLFVLLGAIASQRVDDDISLHMGLDDRAAAAVRQLFVAHTPKFGIAILLAGAMLTFWTLSIVASLQNLYERVFCVERRGMRDAHRFVVWMVALCLSIALVGVSVRPVLHEPGAPVLVETVTFGLLTPFVWWTMHFLLRGRVAWRDLLPAAIATGLCTVGLGVFSKLYFSSTIISDTQLYVSIGAVFSIVTWLIAVATIVVVGAVAGAEWTASRRHEVDLSEPPAHP